MPMNFFAGGSCAAKVLGALGVLGGGGLVMPVTAGFACRPFAPDVSTFTPPGVSTTPKIERRSRS